LTITFETTEFPEYTRDPLYVLDDPELSVQFYGYTKLDGAFGDTDVILSGNPATFHGSTYMEFSEAVRYVRFSVGYIDVEGGVTVKATSPFGQVFTRTSSEVGVREFFEFDFRDSKNIKRSIERIEVIVSSDEPAGAGVNDVTVSDPVKTGRPPKMTTDLDDAITSDMRVFGEVLATADWGRLDTAAPGTVLSSKTMYTNTGDAVEAYSFEFTNGADTSKRFTFEVYSPYDPDEIRTFTKKFSPGSHYVAVSEDRISGDYDGTYVVRLKSVGRTDAYTEDPVYVLTEIFDGIGLSLVGLVNELKAFDGLRNIAQAEKILGKYLGPIGLVLDVGARAVEIASAEDPVREGFAQVVDAVFAYSITYGLLAGGSAVLTPLGGALASLGGSIVYNTFASSEVKEAAREAFDDFTGFEEVPSGASSAADLLKTIGATALAASGADAAGADDADALLTALFDLVDFSDGVPAFDTEYYLEQNPDVAARIASGEIASAYVHYLQEGVFEGLKTYEGQTEVPSPDEVIGAGFHGDPGGRPAVLTPIFIQRPYVAIDEEKPFVGDGASETELAFMDAVVEAFYPHEEAPPYFFDSSRLWAVANRMAWDLVHNYPDEPIAETVYSQPRITEWSDGRTADEIFNFASWKPENLKFFAVAPEAGTPAAAIEELGRSYDLIGTLSQVVQEFLGVAEYGGVYVVAVCTGSIYAPDLVDETHRIDRVGSSLRDEMDLGTWSGTLRGLGGNDRLSSGLEGGKLFGGNGDDELTGRDGRDRLWGDNGDDRLVAGAGRDTLRGGKGDDDLLGMDGADRLMGEKGDDLLIGGAGRDTLLGGNGADLLLGAEGNDRLLGGVGADRIFGAEGNDYLDGGAGRDRLKGGGGEDVFVLGKGRDRILDFEDGLDLLKLSGDIRFKDIDITEMRSGLVLSLDGNAIAKIDGLTAAQLDPGDFLG